MAGFLLAVEGAARGLLRLLEAHGASGLVNLQLVVSRLRAREFVLVDDSRRRAEPDGLRLDVLHALVESAVRLGEVKSSVARPSKLRQLGSYYLRSALSLGFDRRQQVSGLLVVGVVLQHPPQEGFGVRGLPGHPAAGSHVEECPRVLTVVLD